jgi:DNA gyrase subunit B
VSDWLEENPAHAKIHIVQKIIDAAAAREAAMRELTPPQWRNGYCNLARCRLIVRARSGEIRTVSGRWRFVPPGSAKQGRGPHYQAIPAAEGKILNVERARLDRIIFIQGSRHSPIQAKGTAFVDETRKLRYHKVITAIADVDGAYIRTFAVDIATARCPTSLQVICSSPSRRFSSYRSEVYLKRSACARPLSGRRRLAGPCRKAPAVRAVADLFRVDHACGSAI